MRAKALGRVAALAVAAIAATACGGGSDGPGDPVVNTQGAISGRVTDADSANGGMANVTVQATGTAGTRSATTGTNGSFTIGQLDAGQWVVQLTPPGMFVAATGESGTRSAVVAAGQTASVTDFRLARPRGTVSGAVRVGASPLSTTVTLTRQGFSTLQGTSSATTGLFVIASVPAGPWRATVGTTTTHELAAGEAGTRDLVVGGGATAELSAFLLAARPAGPTIVNVQGASFVPPTLTIAAGATVRWVNDGGSHTITPQSSNAFARVAFGSSGTVLEHTFTTPGTYRYRCELHSSDFNSGMVGTITVQ